MNITKMNLSKTDIEQIKQILAETIAGYSGYISLASGVTEIDEDSVPDWQNWYAITVLYASRGKALVLAELLAELQETIDEYTQKLMLHCEEEWKLFLESHYNEVAAEVEEAAEQLQHAYRKSFCKQSSELPYYGDLVESRDLIQFFMRGIEEEFSVHTLREHIEETDQHILDRMDSLELYDLSSWLDDIYGWYPQQFWWHHR